MKKIGLSACFFHADPKRPVFKGKTLLYLEQSMSHFIMREKALAYLIPAPEEAGPVSLAELAEELDALVLQGGSDVSPMSYGETPLKPEWAGDYVRDQYEIALVREFMFRQKPVLGICRGAQLLNVALGGTLYQDIETQLPGSLCHRNWDIYDQNFHDILFEDGRRAKVNSVHHQALKTLGKRVVVEARAPDGIVEAIRVQGYKFAAAVQWHPEFQDRKDKSLLDGSPLMKEFLSAC